ncbi:DUF3331 domain-containing protein [Paraburkholderia bannensis]|uniref:DUF3331 domain-containing protein n=1 Tax=Paraburkholderia bannensis TaxID=765414 RepID=UPI002AB6957E|nr:DUF3331 domain-containing protein [Paraburkholderia bannensis]
MRADIEAEIWEKILVSLLRPAGPDHKLCCGRYSAVGLHHSSGVRVVSRLGRVAILERLDSNTVTVSWNDPQACHYGSQVWGVGTARQSGICAVSGKKIRRGDSVYRPRVSRPAPLNSGAMILVSVIYSVPIDTPIQSSDICFSD